MTLKRIIATATANLRHDPERWTSSQVSSDLGPAIAGYVNFFTKLNVQSYDQLEQVFKTNFHDETVRFAFDELTSVENDWGEMIADVDRYLTRGRPITGNPQQALPQSLQVFDLKGNGQTLTELLTASRKTLLHMVLLRHFA